MFYRRQVVARANDDHAPPRLGHSVVRGVQDLDAEGVIAQLPTLDGVLEIFELRGAEKAVDVLHDEDLRRDLLDHPLVLLPQQIAWVVRIFLAQPGEPLAGRPAQDHFRIGEVARVPVRDIPRMNLRGGEVRRVRRGGGRVELDRGDGLEG